MNTHLPLSNTVVIVAELRERLRAEYNLDDDDQTLADTIEGASDLNEQLAKIAREALLAESMANGIAELLKDTQTRKARLIHRAERLRSLILWALGESGTRKVAAPDLTLSLGAGRAPLIMDDGVPVPEQYCRVKLEPDKKCIREAIENGEEISFARLGNASPTLTIRVK